MKKALSVFALGLALALGANDAVHALQKDRPIAIQIDGTVRPFAVSPVSVDGSVLVPMRAIFEELDAVIEWDQGKRQVTATKGANVLVMTLDANEAILNGESVPLTAAARAIDNHTMVPLRIVGEALGADVRWDSASRAVIIVMPVAVQASGEDAAAIEALLHAHTGFINSKDAINFNSILDKPYETVEQLQAHFKTSSPQIYAVESITDIKVKGNEASAQFIRQVKMIEQAGTPGEYISAILNEHFTVTFVKRAEEWKIVRFQRDRLEQLPLDMDALPQGPIEPEEA
jgi:hypothetical protein